MNMTMESKQIDEYNYDNGNLFIHSFATIYTKIGLIVC